MKLRMRGEGRDWGKRKSQVGEERDLDEDTHCHRGIVVQCQTCLISLFGWWFKRVKNKVRRVLLKTRRGWAVGEGVYISIHNEPVSVMKRVHDDGASMAMTSLEHQARYCQHDMNCWM
jgi:hypothetical protein